MGAIRGIRDKKGLWIIGGIGVIVLLYIVLRLTALRFGDLANFYGGENEYTRSLAIRLFTFCKVLWIYLGLLVWPYPLHMERTVDLVKSFWSPWVLGAFAAIGIGVIGGIWEMRVKKTGWILFGLSWFLVMLVPSSGIIPINGVLYEHWLYVPMVGVLLGVYGLLGLLEKLARRFRPLSHLSLFSLLTPFVILLSIMYLFLTIRQNNIWADPVGFYRYTLSFAPDSARLHNNLGITMANQGNVKEAILEYEKALSLGYGYPQIYNNLGNAYRVEGEYDLAEKNLKKALELSPEFTVAKVNLIKLYLTEKQFEKAESLAQGDQEILKAIGEIRERGGN
jgi:hypothetical protein